LRKFSESSATLHLFGSSANDFGFKSADMDICLMIDESCGTQQKIVQTLGDVLRRSNDLQITHFIISEMYSRTDEESEGPSKS
jgi:DNA polymerase sigma